MMKNILCSLSLAFGLLLSGLVQAQTQVTFYTNMGEFVTEMSDSLSPITSGNFVDLVNQKFYDGVTFHRVIDDFVIQGGDQTGTGDGDAGYEIEDEFHEELSNVEGTLSMANSGPNTGSSQFFVNLVDNTFLDFDNSPLSSAHPVFGSVIQNFDVVKAIGEVLTDADDRPIDAVIMDSLRVTTEIGFEHEIDAGIAEIRGLRHPICGGMTAELILKNFGTEPLTSATINWQINGGNLKFIFFEGALNPGQAAVFEISSNFVLPGENTINAFTTVPNELDDEDPENDGGEISFEVNQSGIPVQFTFTGDSTNPFDNSWQLEDDEGNILRTGGPYSLTNLETSEEWCLENACYSIKVTDKGFDGMSEGGMSVVRISDGETLTEIEDLDFGSQKRFNFCTLGGLGTGELDPQEAYILDSFVDQLVQLEGLSASDASIFAVDAQGRSIALAQSGGQENMTLDVSGLAKGMYWLQVRSESQEFSFPFVIAR